MLAESDAALIDRDQVVPGLRLLMDDRALAMTLMERLPRHHLVSAHTEYLRYKPRQSCLARIRLETPIEHSFAYAIAYGRHAHDKLQNAARLSDVAGTTPLPIPEHGIVVFPFPLDRRLPSLARFAKPSAIRELLRRAAPRLAENCVDIQLSTLRYKPERRFVAQLVSAGRPFAVLKMYAAQVYQAARFAAKTIGSNSAMSSAKYIGRSNRHASLIFDWIDGSSLAAIASNYAQGSEAFSGAARVLQRLHAQHVTSLPSEALCAKSSRLRETEATLTWIDDKSSQQIRAICDVLAKRLNSTHSQPRVPIHGDLHLSQFIVGADGVQLIDFDRARLADPAEDLGNLCADLHRHGIISARGDFFDRLFQHFLQEYAAAGGEVDLDRVYHYAAIRLLELAAEPFRTRQPDWINQTRRYIEASQQLLGATLSAFARHDVA